VKYSLRNEDATWLLSPIKFSSWHCIIRSWSSLYVTIFQNSIDSRLDSAYFGNHAMLIMGKPLEICWPRISFVQPIITCKMNLYLYLFSVTPTKDYWAFLFSIDAKITDIYVLNHTTILEIILFLPSLWLLTKLLKVFVSYRQFATVVITATVIKQKC